MGIEEYAQSLAEAQREPSALPMPVQVTPEERAAHELTHHGKPAWCTHCVAGKDKEDAHFTVDEQSKAEHPILQVDYLFCTRSGERCPDDASKLMTCIAGVNTQTGHNLFACVARKGTNAFNRKVLTQWVREQQQPKVDLRSDSESPITALTALVQKELGHDKVITSTTPRFSHASLGAAENNNALCSASFRTWISALSEKYPTCSIDASSDIVSWLPRHISRLDV